MKTVGLSHIFLGGGILVKSSSLRYQFFKKTKFMGEKNQSEWNEMKLKLTTRAERMEMKNLTIFKKRENFKLKRNSTVNRWSVILCVSVCMWFDDSS